MNLKIFTQNPVIKNIEQVHVFEDAISKKNDMKMYQYREENEYYIFFCINNNLRTVEAVYRYYAFKNEFKRQNIAEIKYNKKSRLFIRKDKDNNKLYVKLKEINNKGSNKYYVEDFNKNDFIEILNAFDESKSNKLMKILIRDSLIDRLNNEYYGLNYLLKSGYTLKTLKNNKKSVIVFVYSSDLLVSVLKLQAEKNYDLVKDLSKIYNAEEYYKFVKTSKISEREINSIEELVDLYLSVI